MITHTILYVADQARSREFYEKLLQLDPILDVPGMTEFQLGPNHVLGLMPEAGIKKLLGSSLPASPFSLNSIRAELYFRVSNTAEMFRRAKELGAKELSPVEERNWGEKAGYVLDIDGYVLGIST